MQKLVGSRTQRAQDQFRLGCIVESDDHGIHGAGLDPADHMLHGFPKLHDLKDHYFGTKPLDFVQKFPKIAQLMLFDEKADG